MDHGLLKLLQWRTPADNPADPIDLPTDSSGQTGQFLQLRRTLALRQVSCHQTMPWFNFHLTGGPCITNRTKSFVWVASVHGGLHFFER